MKVIKYLINTLAVIAFFNANAQTGLQIEEIVVTAQKREQNLNDVALAVTVFSDDEIRQQRLGQPIDLGTNPECEYQ